MNQIIFHKTSSLNRLIHINKEIYNFLVSSNKPRDERNKENQRKQTTAKQGQSIIEANLFVVSSP